MSWVDLVETFQMQEISSDEKQNISDPEEKNISDPEEENISDPEKKFTDERNDSSCNPNILTYSNIIKNPPPEKIFTRIFNPAVLAISPDGNQCLATLTKVVVFGDIIEHMKNLNITHLIFVGNTLPPNIPEYLQGKIYIDPYKSLKYPCRQCRKKICSVTQASLSLRRFIRSDPVNIPH